MEPIWIGIAFILGLAARQVGLPPLVGFLAAGFVLHAYGVESTETIQDFSEMGVTLLLFSIGLKLKVRSLAKPEVWGVASVHMLLTVLVFGLGIYGLGVVGFSVFAGLDRASSLLLAFALSFSSTVFAVKVLEDKGEMGSVYGRVSIGILIMQDIAAVVFLAASTGKIPSPWAIALLAVIPLRRVLTAIMDRSGHGELLILFGLALALGGAEVFELAGVKGDLGALALGVLLGSHPKSSELARSLLGFKDLFLVGFFLHIGLSQAPSLEAIGIALLLAAMVPLKVWLFFWLLTRFRLRARTSLLTSLNLANYSEFGLIVGAIGAANGWITQEWLVIIAVALSTTFVLASPLNSAGYTLYARFRSRLKPFESVTRIPEEATIDTGDATIAIFGMGRVGAGAYDVMREHHGDTVVGVDSDTDTVAEHLAVGRNVIQGSATDIDFWDKLKLGNVRLIMLAMPSPAENMFAARRLSERGCKGLIAAIAKYPDEIAELKEHGVHAAFNIYAEAGAGFAEHVSEKLKEQPG